MPKKICNAVGCNELISMKERYCSTHASDVKRAAHKDYDKNRRNKTHHKFYNSLQWKTVREKIMTQYGGLCKQCSELGIDTPADVVDHIIPLTENWELRLKLSNLQPLCHNCHNKKTGKEDGGAH